MRPPNRSPPRMGCRQLSPRLTARPSPCPCHLGRIRPQILDTVKLSNFFPGSVKNNIVLELQNGRRVRSQPALCSSGRGDDERRWLSAAAEMNTPNEKLTESLRGAHAWPAEPLQSSGREAAGTLGKDELTKS